MTGEEFQPPQNRSRDTDLADVLLQSISFLLGEDDLAGNDLFRANTGLQTIQQVAQEPRVEVQRLDHDIDAVAKRLDHLIRASAGVVVRGQVPGRRRTLVRLVVEFRIIVRQQCQQGRLGARGDAVVFVNDLDSHR